MFYVLCRFKKEGKSPWDATLDGFMHVPARNETALAQAVSQHPVAVAVCCGDNIDNWHSTPAASLRSPTQVGITLTGHDCFCCASESNTAPAHYPHWRWCNSGALHCQLQAGAGLC